mmetsp:Transcript_116150/g.212947  ORF Transcript_116150/g.212947 Transcript_116150/m.212947 type:complete len:300 (+) Transcript_116150:89-988(+)
MLHASSAPRGSMPKSWRQPTHHINLATVRSSSGQRLRKACLPLECTHARVLQRHHLAQRSSSVRSCASVVMRPGKRPWPSGASGDAPERSSASAMDRNWVASRKPPSCRSNKCSGVSPKPFTALGSARCRKSTLAIPNSPRRMASCSGVLASRSVRRGLGRAPARRSSSTAWQRSFPEQKTASCSGNSQPFSRPRHLAFGSARLWISIRTAGTQAWRTASCKECSPAQACRRCSAAFRSGTDCSSTAVLISSCISFAFCLLSGRSGVLIVMTFDGVMMQGGSCTEDDTAFTGVEQNATL